MATRNEWGCWEDPPRDLVGTARRVRSLPVTPPDGAAMIAALYEIDPPMVGFRGCEHRYLIVTAEMDQHGERTLILGADPDGRPQTLDLPGSFDGALDHVRALRRAGYELVD